ncbi:glycosyltransferase family 32 protein [Viridothelium virens]|uniref:Glycosyltransferase family 32 protein n=1 Tax=Viridothelium virens TaxID=1048519 RepID=A0A6A6HEP5_VIRVR|nr:glycosyltransferase family 32 protein [Viridothelium virens]
MISFKRALLIAGTLLTFFLFLRSRHKSNDPVLRPLNSPKPTGSFSDNQPNALQDESNPPSPADVAAKSAPSRTPTDSGERYTHKKPKTQVIMGNVKAKPLREQLAYQFPYDPEGKFPAYIWQTWKYAPASGDFGESLRPSEASWSELHPNFVHEVITDNVAVHLMRHLYASVPTVLDAYNSLPLPVLKADFFRYLILLARGGIYSDIDTAALQSAVNWVPQEVPRSSYGLIIGIEADPDRPDWHEWYSRRIQFCQWTIQAKPGHPVLREIVAKITEDTLQMKREGTLTKDSKRSVMEFTGPGVWTDTVFDYFNDEEYFDMSTSQGNITWEHFTGIKAAKKVGDVVVLPITSFSPGIQTMGAGEDDDPMAFVKHAFEGSWKPESERHIEEKNLPKW